MEKRILIIDNDRASVEPLKAELARNGFLVIVIEDGETSLRFIANEPPDLIILGIESPGMSGVEVLKALRADESTKRLPIIVYAYLENDEAVFRYWHHGPDCTLSKPGSTTEIVAFLKRIFTSQLEGD